MDKKNDHIQQRILSLESGDERKIFALMKQGDNMMKQRMFQDALTLYGDALKQAPKFPELRERIAHVFLLQNDFHNALRHYRRTYRLGITSAEVITKIAVCLDRLGLKKDCFDWIARHLHIEETPARFNIIAARHFQINGELEKALFQTELALQKEPDNRYAKATFETLQNLKNFQTVRSNELPLRIAFHLNEAFHYAIMKPIFDVLKAHYQILITEDFNWLQWFNPSVVFVANAQAGNMRKYLPQSIFIYTRHGLISKNFVYDAAQTCDYVCLPSEDTKSDFIDLGGFKPERLWVTGYAQMDPLFRNEHLPIPVPILNNAECVLYAPTFTEGLSSLPQVTPIIETGKLDADRQLVIKPHPLSSRFQGIWMNRLRAYAATKDNVHFIEDRAEDIMPYLARADILISDASSVMFQYLALDRPIVAVNNPERFSTPRYDPDGIEWKWRDMTHEIDDVNDLAALVADCLKHPKQKQALRAKYRKALFGGCTDGQTGKKILSHLRHLNLDKIGELNATS